MKKMLIACVLAIIILVYRAWFLPGLLVSGDFSFFYSNSFSHMSLFPSVWDAQRGGGLGGAYAIFLWPHFLLTLPTALLGRYMHVSWPIIERIVYLFPYLLIAAYSMYQLGKRVIGNTVISWISVLIYMTNTYVLMLLQGGQVQIALAYGLSPLVIAKIYDVLTRENNKKVVRDSVLTGVFLSLVMMYDIRICYILLAAIFIYLIFHTFITRWKSHVIWLNILYVGVVPLSIAGISNLFWILPTIFSGRSPADDVGSALLSSEALSYFSFAKLDDSLSLLHPNWPENIFGKVDFFSPIFLIIPIFAFSSLLFLDRQKDNHKRQFILFFLLLGILGAFLGKGVQDPVGFIYMWLFTLIPGFSLFRDPTKWYMLTALSYSVLIPFTLREVAHLLQTKGRYISVCIVGVFLLAWVLLIHQSFGQKFGGIFQSSSVPSSYQKLATFLANDSSFYRTLWFPTTSKYGFYSTTHPLVTSPTIFNTYDQLELEKRISSPGVESRLQESGISYVIIPDDVRHEVFITDRRYDEKKYPSAVKTLSKIPWLQRIDGYGRLAVFLVPSSFSHVFSIPFSPSLSTAFISPAEYRVTIPMGEKNMRVVFSETYDKNWYIKDAKTHTNYRNEKYHLFNSVVLPHNGNYVLQITYTTQQYVWIGIVVSALCGISILMMYLLARKHK